MKTIKTLLISLFFILLSFPAYAGQPWTWRISWVDTNSNETDYSVERKIGSGGTYQIIGTTGVNGTFLDDVIADDPGSTTYFYRVRAHNAAGFGPYSVEVSATTDPLPAPGQVVNLAANIVGNNVNITWNAVPTAVDYVIEKSVDGGAFFQLVVVTTNSHVNPIPNTLGVATWKYRVFARNSAGIAGPTSSEVIVNISIPPNGAPTGLTVTKQ